MNIYYNLIAKVLEDKAFSEAKKQGLKASMFQGKERIMWDMISSHYEDFGRTPSVDMFKELIPSYNHFIPEDTIDALIHEIKTQHLAENMQTGLQQISKLLYTDPWSAQNALSVLSHKLIQESQSMKTTFVVGQDSEEYCNKLRHLKDNDGVTGIPWPWEFLNKHSTGIAPGQLYYIYGWHKTKKTWLNLYLAYHFWKLGKRVLWFNREMSYEDQLDHRIACLILRCKFEGGTPAKGDLTEKQFKYLKKEMDALYNSDRWRIEDVFGGIGAIQAKVEEFQPDIIIHDYFKALVEDATSGKNITNDHAYVSRAADELANFVKRSRIPLFFTGHVNRDASKDGSSKTEHAHSAHITRRVSAAFRVISSFDEQRLALVVNAGRDIMEGIGFTISGELCETFGDFIEGDYSWVHSDGSGPNASQPTRARSVTADEVIADFDASSFMR